MKNVYTLISGNEQFESVREQYVSILAYLQSDQALAEAHGDVEKNVWADGIELLRRMFQCHLDHRTKKERRYREVKGKDSLVRGYCREKRTRQLETLFGGVTVGRKVYSEAGHDSLFPLDGELNLGKDKYSHGLKERVVDEVIKGSFDEAVTAIQKTTGGRVPKRQLEEVSVAISQDFEAFYDDTRTSGAEQTDDLLVLSFDGKGIVMRQEDLREATKKAAQKASKKRKPRLGTGEKRNRKRMATVAAVYSVEPHVCRSAQAIVGDETEDKRPRARNKRVWASVERGMATVIEETFQAALQRDPEKTRQWVVLVDGDEQQQRLIKAAIKRHNVDAIRVIDFIHVLEYLWKAAYCFHQPDSDEAETWVSERALKLLQGKASGVAAGMRRSATLRHLSKKARMAVDKCAEYLLKNQAMARYDVCLKRGLPIATGVIEGACRHLINDRLDITGARWRLQGAEAILKFRSLRSSGDLDDYWAFHKAQEFERNHASRYQRFPSRIAA